MVACEVCGKQCHSIKDLSIHMDKHIPKGSFICFCGKVFTQNAALVAHTRTHTGEKPYLCDYCDSAFSQSGSLLRHKRTHTGEKIYSCDDPNCGMAFTYKRALNRHIKKLHSNEPVFHVETHVEPDVGIVTTTTHTNSTTGTVTTASSIDSPIGHAHISTVSFAAATVTTISQSTGIVTSISYRIPGQSDDEIGASIDPTVFGSINQGELPTDDEQYYDEQYYIAEFDERLFDFKND